MGEVPVAGLTPDHSCILISGLLAAEWLQRNRPAIAQAVSLGTLPALAWRYALIAAILCSFALAQQGSQPFIYFQF